MEVSQYVNHYNDGNVDIVKIRDGLDAYTVPGLDAILRNLTNKKRHRIVVDLGQVDWIDGNSLTFLTLTLKRIRMHDGDLKIVIIGDRILRPFKECGLTRIFKIYHSVSDAVDAFAVEY